MIFLDYHTEIVFLSAMDLTKEDIKRWVDVPSRGREWLAAKCSTPDNATAVGTVNNWLTTKKVKIPSRALLIIQKLMEETAAQERAQEGLPERISIEASREEFTAWDRASRKDDAESLESWIVATLNKAADVNENSSPLSLVAETEGKEGSSHSIHASGVQYPHKSAKRTS